jgi:hypothetical protein
MKNIFSQLHSSFTTIILSSFFVGLSTTQAAQTVTKDFGTFGAWNSAIIQAHDLSSKDACLSSTKADIDASTLELYAEKLSNQTADLFTEPTFQVVLRSKFNFVRAVLADDQATSKVHLTMLTNQNNPPQMGLLARIDDRASLLALIKKANSIKIQLIDSKNIVTKTLTFSLKGSSKALDAAVTGCKLTL